VIHTHGPVNTVIRNGARYLTRQYSNVFKVQWNICAQYVRSNALQEDVGDCHPKPPAMKEGRPHITS